MLREQAMLGSSSTHTCLPSKYMRHMELDELCLE